MILGWTPIFYLCAFTGLVVGWFAWRGTGDLLKACLAGLLAFGIVLVVPIVAVMVGIYLVGLPREAAYDFPYVAEAIVAGNLVAWTWLAWQRWVK